LNWFSYIGVTWNKRGYALAYKIINSVGEGIYNGGINYLNGEEFGVKEVDPDVYKQCSFGINLATFRWCLETKSNDTQRCLLFRFNKKDAVCPVASDGKFRVKKCTKIAEVDWNGNII